MLNKKSINIIYYFILLAIFSLGIFLRIKGYLYNKSFWYDEAALALNIMNRSFLGFLQPLDYTQCAPFLFLASAEILTLLFGTSEYVFRFLPLISGILSIFVFYFLSKQFLNKKWSILVSCYLFCVNYNFIYYCEEFKQYSLEVLFTILLLLYLSKLDLNSLNNKKCIILGCVFFLALLFSIPAIFILGTFIFYLLYKNKKNSIKQIFFILLPFMFLFTPYYLIFFAPMKNIMSDNYWTEMNVYLNILNFWEIIRDFLSYTFRESYRPSCLISLILGIFITIKEKKRPGALFVIILFLAVSASFLKLYPLFNRLGLYLAPILILFAIKPLDILAFDKKHKIILSIIIIILSCLYLKMSTIKYVSRFSNPDMFCRTQARDLIQFIKDNMSENDIFISDSVKFGQHVIVTYYFKRYDIKFNQIIFLSPDDFNKRKYILNTLASNKIYWFFNSRYGTVTFDKAVKSEAEKGNMIILQEIRPSSNYDKRVKDYALRVKKL